MMISKRAAARGLTAVALLSLPLVCATIARAQDPAPEHAGHMHSPADAPATGVELTLEDLLRRSSEHHPALKQAEAEVRRAQAEQRQAGAYPNPTVGYTADEISGGPLVRGGEHGIFVEQTLVTAGKLHKRRDLQTRALEQAQARADAQRVALQNGIRRRFYSALAAEQRLQVHQQMANLATEAVRTSQGLYNVGQADQPDLLQAEIESQQIQLDLQTATLDSVRSRQELIAAVGDSSLTEFSLKGEFDEPLADIDPGATLAAILRDSPEIKLAQAGGRRGQSGLALARSSRFPDIVVRSGVRYNRELFELGGKPVGWEGFVDAGVRIPLFNRHRDAIAAAAAGVESSEQDLRRVEFSLRERFARSMARYQKARRTANAYEQEIIPRAEKAYQLYSAKFKEMAAAYPQVLIAQRTLLQVTLRHISAVEDAHAARVSLQGFLLDEGPDREPLSAEMTQPGEDEP